MLPYSSFLKYLTLLASSMMLALLFSNSSFAYNLSKTVTNDDNILLLNTLLNKKPLIEALDTYLVDDKLMIAVEPLFDSLTLRYIRETNLLRVWKDQQIIDIQLSQQGSSGNWADDGFYLYIDSNTFRQLFNVNLDYNTATLILNITTKNFRFPKQKLSTLAQQRQLEQSAVSLNTDKLKNINLLADQYRAFTIPHGSITLNSVLDRNKKTSLNYSVQTVSDLLYHSTNLTISDTNNGDLVGRLNFSRYKSLPNKRIAGLIDEYSVGDINNLSDNLTNNTQSGLGFVLSRAPELYRNRDVGTTITEIALPGWDAELYRNGVFIELKKVPSDGNLIFSDVETQYGYNRYEIKLYGPFGEEEIRTQDLILEKNALAKGEMAYNLYGFDDDQTLINNKSNEGYTLNNTGAAISYGITNNWLMGFNYVTKKDSANQQQTLITLKNSFAFPGLLFNNEISLQENAGYAQISSLSGNGVGQDTFNFIYESSDDYQSGRINSAGISRNYADFNYSGDLKLWYYTLGVSYTKVDNNKSWQVRNLLSRTIANINFTNNIYYNRSDFSTNSVASWNGSFVAAGSLTKRVRLSASIDYRPDVSQVIQNAAFTLGWNDSFNLYHNLQGVYRLKESANKWKLNYNLSWNSEQFQLQLAANYDAQSDWTVGLGVRFFLSYDYQNRKVIFSSELATASATINSYSYLDRNPNGWRDEADWDLQGVKFTGIPAWKNLTSGATGRTILPGVTPYAPFKFNAEWEYGTKSLGSNFNIYTHPGAYIDVNMPFYVTTDFSGFVFKLNYYGQQTPLSGAIVELLNSKDKLIEVTFSDIDGYYQFINIIPGNYQVRVANDYLKQSGYTGKIIGYQLNTPSTGGIIELDAINLEKLPISQKKQAESVIKIDSKTLNLEPNVWFDEADPNVGQVYSLAPAGEYSTQQKYSEPDDLPNTPITRAQLPSNPVVRAELPVQPVTRQQLSSQPIIRTQLPVQPVTRQKLPVQPIVSAKLSKQTAVKAKLEQTISTSSVQPKTRTQLPVQPIIRDRLPIQPIVRKNLPVNPLTGELLAPTLTVEIPPTKASKAIVKQLSSALVTAKSADTELFTIQLGVYSNKKSAEQLVNRLTNLPSRPYLYTEKNQQKNLFRVIYGQFNSRKQAKQFAKNNLAAGINSYVRVLPKTIKHQQPLTIANLGQGYVIQLIAGQNKFKILARAQEISGFNKIYLAEKQLNNKTWYCLITQTFIDKRSAKEILAAAGISAWVVDIKSFQNIVNIEN
jgi:cell division protein FtsN